MQNRENFSTSKEHQGLIFLFLSSQMRAHVQVPSLKFENHTQSSVGIEMTSAACVL